MATRIQVVFAAKDPERLAAFWRTALNYEPEPPPPGYDTWEAFAEANGIDLQAGSDIDSAIDPDGVGPRLLFERDTPHASGAVHLDVNAAAGRSSLAERKQIVNAEVERLLAVGATKTKVVDRDDHYWVELEDPEGNWFCVQ
jgi:glyoxalase superfamily protein